MPAFLADRDHGEIRRVHEYLAAVHRHGKVDFRTRSLDRVYFYLLLVYHRIFLGKYDSLYSELMLERNSLLALVLLSLSIRSSMASTGESGLSTLRSTQIRCRSSLGMSNSSLRVPER
jgi:hypothetical protein